MHSARLPVGCDPYYYGGLNYVVSGKVLLAGRCCCGEVDYQIDGALSNLCFCHCESCRRASGAPYVAWGTAIRDHFTVTEGEIGYFSSSARVRRGFCANCGTTLTYKHQARPQELDIALATLDNPTAVSPEYHIWLADKLEWVVINDGLPCYQGWKSSG